MQSPLVERNRSYSSSLDLAEPSSVCAEIEYDEKTHSLILGLDQLLPLTKLTDSSLEENILKNKADEINSLHAIVGALILLIVIIALYASRVGPPAINECADVTLPAALIMLFVELIFWGLRIRTALEMAYSDLSTTLKRHLERYQIRDDPLVSLSGLENLMISQVRFLRLNRLRKKAIQGQMALYRAPVCVAILVIAYSLEYFFKAKLLLYVLAGFVVYALIVLIVSWLSRNRSAWPSSAESPHVDMRVGVLKEHYRLLESYHARERLLTRPRVGLGTDD